MAATEAIQAWLDLHCAGEQPPLDDLCQLCEDRARQLVRPRLRQFPLVVQDSQTTAVMDDAFMRLLQALKQGVRPATHLDLERFLARIIRRVLIDSTKAIKRRRLRFNELVDEPASETDSEIADIDMMAALHEYVEALPPDEQALFDVFYYQGKTKAEAAKLLGMPETTAHRHWTKARLRASRHLGADLTE